MNSKRKKVEDYILKYISKIMKNDFNVKLYKDMFSKMSDKEFHKFMEDLRDGNINLQFIVPHELEKEVSIDNNFKIGKELGIKFYSRLKIKGKNNMPDYFTKDKYLILRLPIRKLKQTIGKGISITENRKRINTATGQPIDDSRASTLTLPEIQLLTSMGLEKSVVELMKDRGGDTDAFNILISSMIKHGRSNRNLIDTYSIGSKPRSLRTLKAYLRSMMLKDTL